MQISPFYESASFWWDHVDVSELSCTSDLKVTNWHVSESLVPCDRCRLELLLYLHSEDAAHPIWGKNSCLWFQCLFSTTRHLPGYQIRQIGPFQSWHCPSFAFYRLSPHRSDEPSKSFYVQSVPLVCIHGQGKRFNNSEVQRFMNTLWSSLILKWPCSGWSYELPNPPVQQKIMIST